MKRILLLGAGFMQKPAIDCAKELGCFVTAVDGNPQAYCVPFVHRFEPIDLKDTEKLLSFAKHLQTTEGLDGVFTAGTDFSAAVSYIAEHCHLCGHSYEAACNASDKIRMRACFAKDGVPSPAFCEIDASFLSFSVDEILEKAGFSDYIQNFTCLVVKPVDNMGARGCRMVQVKEDLLDALQTAIQYSRSGRAILEEYMDGPEFSLDSLVYDGKITITGFADRHIFYPPYFIEMGHTMPTVLSEDEKNEVIRVFALGVKSLGLTCGAAKGDIKFTKKGVMIGEIAARLSGGYMSGWTYPYSSQINLTKEALRIALGMKPSVNLAGGTLEGKFVSAERAWVSIPGKIKNIIGYEKARALPYVKEVFPRNYIGDTVNFPLNNVEKCGNIITQSASYTEACLQAEKAVASIVLVLEKESALTENFLNQSLAVQFPPAAFNFSENFVQEFEASLQKMDDVVSSRSLLEQMPPALQKIQKTVTDWNHRTIEESLSLFSELCPHFKPIKASLFWHYLMRGGIQGILYLAEENTP
ncbi:MAG: ATP-grasp domain-containing protein [Spirochaetaceae bacterium]|nr:ATP-grasp domain-containing protein [Spirochaetaceae bacterium]